MKSIRLQQGDITQLKVDAIVNAANSSLLGGGGVDGAIHRAAGSDLLEECRKIGGCPPGEARITNGYKLAAKHVIHTVGPVWQGGKAGEEEVLRSAYHNSMKLGSENGLKSLAFPNISTGIYGFPKELAATIALKTAKDYLENYDESMEIIFVCFDDENYKIYQGMLE